MKYYTKRIFILFIGTIGITVLHSCRSKSPWNPYLTAKEKPSDKERKEEQKQLKSGTKAYAIQMKKNKKNIQGNIQRSTSMKSHYHVSASKRTRNKKWHF